MVVTALNTQSRLIEKKVYSWRTAVSVAFAMGLSISYFDFLTYMIRGFFRPHTFGEMLMPVGATIVFVALVYLILWFTGFYPAGRFLKLDHRCLAVSLGGFTGAAYILFSAHNQIEFGSFPSDLRILLLWTGSILVCSFVAWAAFVGAQKISQRVRLCHFLAILFLSMPYILAESLMTVWVHKFLLSSKVWGSFVVYGGFLAVAGGTLIFFMLLSDIKKLYRMLLLLSVISIAGSWGSYANMVRKSAVSTEGVLRGHPIKHVILISVDTLRADALSCYGNTRISTPNTGRLADDGVFFENAFASSSWTIPSTASFMTGLSPKVHRATSFREIFDAEKIPTLAQYMRDEGYLTCGMVANSVLWRKDFEEGFMTYPRLGDRKGKALVGGFLRLLYKKRNKAFDLTHEVTKSTLGWLDENADKDFFLWLHYLDPHLPYRPPARFLEDRRVPAGMENTFNAKESVRIGYLKVTGEQRDWVRVLYEAEVRYVDECIGKVVDRLKELNIYDEALIVFTSDHGEELWEHDGFEHGHTLYSELVAVPLIFKLPKSSSRAHISDRVANCAITPTLLDLAAVEYDSEHLSVASLSRYWENPGGDYDEAPIIGGGQLFYEEKDSVVFDGMKYIRSLGSGRKELYDLNRDPEERSNLIHEAPDKAEKAETILTEHQEVSNRLREHFQLDKGKREGLDQESLDRLKSLGYVK